MDRFVVDRTCGSPLCGPHSAWISLSHIKEEVIRPAIVASTGIKPKFAVHVPYGMQHMCMKSFKSSNVESINECQSYFRCLLPSLNVRDIYQKCISKYENSANTFYQYCSVL